MNTYIEVRQDHEFLWKVYAPAKDMTGGYVDQDDLHNLLRAPTKVTAKKCYLKQIYYWFQVGPDCNTTDWKDDQEVWSIAEKYCADMSLLK